MPSRVVRRRPWRRRGQHFLPSTRSLRVGQVQGAGGALVGGSATVAFGHAGGSVASNIKVLVDWDDDGDFSESVEDITSLVMSLETDSGRDWPSLLTGTAGPGRLRGTLNNAGDDFSYFQSDSPLNQAPFSLNLGGKIRVQASGTVVADPVLLLRDRFRRSDAGDLGDEEQGKTWLQQLTYHWGIVSEVATAAHEGSPHLAYLNLGAADYYLQALVYPGSLTNRVGLVIRYVDTVNYSLVLVNAGSASLEVINVVAGIESTVSATPIEVYAGTTIGVHVSGASLTVYVEGVSTATATAINTSATLAGLYGQWGTGDTAPGVDNIYAWDGLPAAVEGVLWTGDVTDLVTAVEAGPHKLATIEGQGWLARMATQTVTPPTSATGRRTGLLLGAVLAQAGLLHPPLPISLGDITTGPFALSPTTALEVARRVEETEFGFVHETNEGYIGFESRSTRDSVASSAGFSDASGAQFGYTQIAPSDWRREVFNRIIAGVSPYTLGTEQTLYTDPGPYVLGPTDSVTLTASYSGSGVVTQWTGHTRQVSRPQEPSGITVSSFTAISTSSSDDPGDFPLTVTLPTTAAGDLLLVIAQIQNRNWDEDVPSGWTLIYGSGISGYKTIVIAREAAGNEAGNTAQLLSAEGLFTAAAHLYRVTSWWGDVDTGVQVAAQVTGTGVNPNPPAIVPAWGAIPTMFIACAGMGGISGGTSPAQTAIPSGYGSGQNNVVGSSGQWGWMSSSRLIATTASEDPGTYTENSAAVSNGWTAWTVAVRGSAAPVPVTGSTPAGANGSFTVGYDSSLGGTLQSVTDIEATGILLTAGDTVQVQVDSTTSQDRHKAIKTYRNPADLFANPADALIYAQLVLDTHASDRPILSISFAANKSAAYRLQAIRRRIGDKITLVADNNSGLGVSADFFIENIAHRWSHGTRLWEVTWQLSPA